MQRLKLSIGLVAVLVTAGLAGVALAGTPTLRTAPNGEVTDQSHTSTAESIVVNARGFAVYYLTGDRRGHPECTAANGCFSFWPPVKVASVKRLAKATGVAGKLRVWQRHGFLQVTLGGHPLYTFSGDMQRSMATGEGIHHFGGTWHVVKTAVPAQTMT